MENIIKLNVETMTEEEKTILLGIILKNGGLVIEGNNSQDEDSEGKAEYSPSEPETESNTAKELDYSEERAKVIHQIKTLRDEGKTHQQIRKTLNLPIKLYSEFAGIMPEEVAEEARKKGNKKRLHTMEKRKRNIKREIERHSKYFGGTLNDSECAKLTGVSPATIGKYKKELFAEKAA